MKEHIRYRIDHSLKKRSLKITQPIIIQIFIDEFDLLNRNLITLMPTGHITKKGEEYELINKKEQKTYQSGVGKMLHLSR